MNIKDTKTQEKKFITNSHNRKIRIEIIEKNFFYLETFYTDFAIIRRRLFRLHYLVKSL